MLNMTGHDNDRRSTPPPSQPSCPSCLRQHPLYEPCFPYGVPTPVRPVIPGKWWAQPRHIAFR